MDGRSLLLLLSTGAGVIAALLAVPLSRRRIPPNGWYGFRMPSTLHDPTRSCAVNALSGRWLLVAGLTLIFAALLLYRIDSLSLDNYAWACLAAFLTPFGIGFIAGLRRAHAPGQ